MRELSIFVDESGDFGEYVKHSPYYFISMVFHDQEDDISKHIKSLEDYLTSRGLPKDFYIHTGPIIRNEGIFKKYSIIDRRRFFAKLFGFFIYTKTNYTVFMVEKKHTHSQEDIIYKFEKQMQEYIRERATFFQDFDTIKIYYDNGQAGVRAILEKVFSETVGDFEIKKDVEPNKYKLFQASDLVCTLELLNRKIKDANLSKSEMNFFGNTKRLKKSYIRILRKRKI